VATWRFLTQTWPRDEGGICPLSAFALRPDQHESWEGCTRIECLHYALNLPTSVVITGIDSMEILEQAFEAVRTYEPLTYGQVKAILQKTEKAAAHGEFEPFKTPNGLAKNPGAFRT
jgi:hypothetical protein